MAISLYSRVRRKLVSAVRRLMPAFFYRRLEAKVELRCHWVKPSQIKHALDYSHSINGISEPILDGDWDQDTVTFEDLSVFNAFRQVMEQQKPWHESAFYEETVGEIKKGNHLWKCTSEEEFVKRLKSLEVLYQEIKEVGYFQNNNHNEIQIAIGRHGDLLHYDGRHRLTIAKLLGIESVPVRIVARHRNWVKFKNEILQFARSHNGQVYSPLMHPDLEWIPSFYGHKRFELIRRALTASQGKMLDIGCNWGYFCQRFEELGFDCTGVEFDPYCYYFLDKLKRARGMRFQAHNCSIFEFVEKQKHHEYEVVLGLAIFHHFIKTKEECDRLKILLKKVKTKELYFLPHRNSETQMKNAYWNPSEEDFAEFLMENSGLNHLTCLGFVEDGRKLFRLSL